MKKFLSLALMLCVFLISCSEAPVPKPKGMFRLDYPEARYEALSGLKDCPYEFEISTLAKGVPSGKCDLRLEYPGMKAAVYLTYKPIEGNLELLLRDAQKLTYEHVIKADQITEQPFVNSEHKVYGMFYDLQGNAASPAQLYVTDSIHHFVTASLYFEARPNYDSVMPAARYLQNDLRKLMETFRWK